MVGEWDKKDLQGRQQKLEDYLFGKQVDKDKLFAHQMPYKENIIWEAHVRNKAIAVSRIPEIIVKDTSSPTSKQTAESLTKLMNDDFKKRERKNVLAKAYVQRPVNFYSVVKARWNPQKGKHGNYEFINVDSKDVILDAFCRVSDSDSMSLIAERREMEVKMIIMMFPHMENEILEELGFEEGKSKDKYLQSRVTVWETWFDYYKKPDEEEEKSKYEKVHGLMWTLNNLILDKMKNPYYDYEGNLQYFKFVQGQKEEVDDIELFESMFGETELEVNKVYNNHFKNPRKPYFIMTYQTWNSCIDETTNYEQVLEIQDNINATGRQIHGMNARSRGKNVFSSEGLDKKEVAKIDFTDPSIDISVSGNVRDVHSRISQPPAPPQLYQSKDQDRSIGFQMMALNATTRGSLESSEAGLGQSQIAKEQDMGVIDDMADDTINRCSEWMAEWSLQFIKLFYKKPHYVRVLGQEGEYVQQAITQDLVTDGIEVEVGASSTDKMQKKREAYERARMQMTDPLTFFKDTEAPDPEDRTEKLMLYMLSPELYIQKYLAGRDTQDMVTMLQQQSMAGQVQPAGGQPQPQPQQGMPTGGGNPNQNRVNAQPDHQNKSWFSNFRHLDKNNMI